MSVRRVVLRGIKLLHLVMNTSIIRMGRNEVVDTSRDYLMHQRLSKLNHRNEGRLGLDLMFDITQIHSYFPDISYSHTWSTAEEYPNVVCGSVQVIVTKRSVGIRHHEIKV